MSNISSHEEQARTSVLAPNDFGKLAQLCSEQSIAYLEDSLRRLEKGVPPTPSFKLYGKTDSSLVEEALNLLGNMQLPGWLLEYEKSRVTKFGPQGGVPPWKDVADDFLLYKTALKPVRFVDTQIIAEMKGEYAKLHCSQMGAREVLSHLIRSNKIETRAAGWSEFQLKKTDRLAQEIAVKYAKEGTWKHGVGYVFTKFQKQKNRIFMPMPFSSMIVQAEFFVPFLGGIQRSLLEEKSQSPFTAWADKVGFDQCFDFLEDEINQAHIREDEYIVYFSNDFLKMDTRTGTEQYRAFVLPVFGAAFGANYADEALLFTTTAPIYSPSGTMDGDHGTASGAEVTNGGECCCNDYFQRRHHKRMRAKRSRGWRVIARRLNGDDSTVVYAVHKSISYTEFETLIRESLQEVSDETGFDVQTEKLGISLEFGTYCQNVFSYDRVSRKLFWTYPFILTLNSIVNPVHQYTKSQWDKDYRDIDIAEKLNNIVRYPDALKLVKFVDDGLQYPLMGRSEPETKRILSKWDKYRALQTLGERYNRQDFHIEDAPIMDLIRKLRAV
jgi:hypothetical protein